MLINLILAAAAKASPTFWDLVCEWFMYAIYIFLTIIVFAMVLLAMFGRKSPNGVPGPGFLGGHK